MVLTDEQRTVIDRWISAVETGDPAGNYGKVTVLADGPGGRPQVTYGKHQTTENGGNVQKLILAYLESQPRIEGRAIAALWRFVRSARYSQAGEAKNGLLRRALELAGSDPRMREIQENFFGSAYMSKAMAWADENGFREALSGLVIYDSFVQSGGIPSWIRRRFIEAPPAGGGSERVWIRSYVEARHQWLKHWGDGIDPKSVAIRASQYRTAGLLELLAVDDWSLSSRPIVVNGITAMGGRRPVDVEPVAEARPVESQVCPTCGGSGRL